MPLYEYQCEACGHRFEAIQKFSDQPLETCPRCGGALTKLQSAPAFQFKGSGWYITDYARKDAAGPEKKDSAASETKSDAKSETKPETKTETKTEAKTESKKSEAGSQKSEK